MSAGGFGTGVGCGYLLLVMVPLTVLAMTGGLSSANAAGVLTSGPLRRHARNPRYFADGSGRAVYLTGSHTWWNLQDRGSAVSPPFDYGHFLDVLAEHNHNFFRLWVFEQAAWVNWAARAEGFRFSPLPYERTGPGQALDGGLRFDLSRFNPGYFERLRSRVLLAGERGFYVSIMLFEGWSIEMKGRPATNGNPWEGHPFRRENNINGIDGDPKRTGDGRAAHTMALPEVTALQQAYVRKVVDTVNDLDNVLYEISNESHGDSVEWQYACIKFVKEYERGKPKQHPVGMTVPWPGGTNEMLLASPADWVSPNPGPANEYREDPPAADGAKVIVSDTDHLWGIGGNVAWVWKSFTRGLNPIFMDPWEPRALRDPEWDRAAESLDAEGIRLALGHARRYAERMDLSEAKPLGGMASTGYCLAKPGEEYLVFQPGEGSFTVDLTAGKGKQFVSEWCEPRTGKRQAGERVSGGATTTYSPPFAGPAVLYLVSLELAKQRSR